jgi:chromate transporter
MPNKPERTRSPDEGDASGDEFIPSLESLFFSFFKLGLTAFGGPAMVPYVGKLAVEQRKWLDADTFRDGVALCQSIPGATAMQTSAYVGFRARGVGGAAVSFIGFGLPAFLLMVGLSAFYVRSHSMPPVIAVFNGLQTIVVAIVASAALSFGKASVKSWRDGMIAMIAAGMFVAKVSPILAILLAALLGLALLKKNSPPELRSGLEKPSCSPKPLLILIPVTAFAFVALFFLDRKLFDLAAIMFRIDLFAFGGGFASVPLMFHEIVGVRSWMDAKTFLNGIALGQITPGPIVITSTFVGYWIKGPIGAVVATMSIFLPSFLILIGIVPHFDRLRTSIYFDRAISAVLCSFVGLLLAVTFRFALNVPWDVARALIAFTAFVALLLKVEILWIVLLGTAISVFWL